MKMEDLHNTLISFHQELLSFRQEFLSFRHDMCEFRDDMGKFKEDMEVFKDDMCLFKEETNVTLNKHSRTLIGIENKLNFFGDMYKINKDEIRALDKRVTVLRSV